MTLEPDEAQFQLHALSNVRPLRPIRVFLAGRDRRYIRTMAFLLAQRGYAARHSGNAAALFEEIDSFSPDVVVVAEGESFGDAVGDAVALLGRSDSFSVVVSTSRSDPPSGNRLRFVQKWCSFDRFVEAIERAWADMPPA